MGKTDDQYKEVFRPSLDTALEREINEALGDVSMDAMYDARSVRTIAAAAAKGMRRGRIARLDLPKNEVLIDFGGKDQGVCPLTQFTEEPKIGDEIDFVVVRRDPKDDILVVSLKGAKATNVNWQSLEVGQLVDGTVTGVNKGGLEVDIKGMRAFMPAGQVDIYHTPDVSVYLNQRMTVEVTQCNRETHNIIVSRRNVLEQEREVQKKKFFEDTTEGTMLRGTVRNVVDFGAFVDIGGVDGLIPIGEMSFKRIGKASDVLKVGDIVDVKVIKISKDTGRITLSLKQAMPDPWLDAATKYPVGSTLTGLVMRLETFGAFIQIEEGLEALLPISEMSYQRIKSASEIVSEGQAVKLVVLSVDEKARRMSLSIKQAGPDPWKTAGERYVADMVTTGRITRTAEFGAFVELEPGIEGMIHISELSGQRVNSVSQVVQVGQEVKVAVLEVDTEHRRISLSIKKLAELVVPERAPESNKPKKPRPQLRGGLDFDYKKNK